MKKIFCVALAAALALCLPPLTFAAVSSQTNVSFTYEPEHPIYFITVDVEKLSGNQNQLTVTVTEVFSDGSEKVITETFLIENNSSGTYQFGGYSVYVETTGGIQVRRYEVVGSPGGSKDAPVSAADAQFISIAETAKNSKVWALTFKAALTFADGTSEFRTFTINLSGNNNNLSGKYKFDDGHDLAGYTLIYDIAGNNSNVKAFKFE